MPTDPIPLLTVALLAGVVLLFISIEWRLRNMVTKAELESQVDQLGTAIGSGLTALGDVIATETQQVLDAIAAGQDLTSISEKVTGIQTAFSSALGNVQQQIEAIVTPSEPAPEPEPEPEPEA